MAGLTPDNRIRQQCIGLCGIWRDTVRKQLPAIVVVFRSLSKSSFFAFDSGMTKPGVLSAAYMLATITKAEADYQGCLASLRRIRWAYASVSEDESALQLFSSQSRQGMSYRKGPEGRDSPEGSRHSDEAGQSSSQGMMISPSQFGYGSTSGPSGSRMEFPPNRGSPLTDGGSGGVVICTPPSLHMHSSPNLFINMTPIRVVLIPTPSVMTHQGSRPF